jgi:phosphoribosyl-AMP cyclohydrolase / phosphoribosyl-ATP pyrophosphohydrolase
LIIPSIDLMNGKAVKLIRGNPKKRKFEEDALELAKKFSIYPEINLIDLDAAFAKGNNSELIRKICKICNCNVGGGIRTTEKAYEILKIGANKIIIGTMANKDFLSKLPKERVIVAIDSKKEKVVTNGWKESTIKSPFQRTRELQKYCAGFLYTYVDKEGTMEEIDFKTITTLRKITDKRIQYAGGISSKEQILEFEKFSVDSVIGMAYYKSKIDINDSFVSILNFEKGNGLIPTITKDEKNRILMLAFSNKESVLKSLKTRKGVYFSRTRKKLWKKGETSGNMQELLRVGTDCDRDTLVFTVRQKNIACHTGTYSCFGDKKFGLDDLIDIIKSKKGSGSFTDTMLNDVLALKRKILEEAGEVANYRNKENLRWEISDLLYFVSILMVKNNISFDDIEKELEIRNVMKKLIKSTKLG